MKHVVYILILTPYIAFAQIDWESNPSSIIDCLNTLQNSFRRFNFISKQERTGQALADFNDKLKSDKFPLYITLDEELSSGKIKKRILTLEGQFNCIYDKKYKDSNYISYRKLIKSKFISKTEPNVFSFNNSINCKKVDVEADTWSKTIKKGISLSPHLYRKLLFNSKNQNIDTSEGSPVSAERYLKEDFIHKPYCLRQSDEHKRSYINAENKIKQIYSSSTSSSTELNEGSKSLD